MRERELYQAVSQTRLSILAQVAAVMCPLASGWPCQNIYIVGENVMPIIPTNPSSGTSPQRRSVCDRFQRLRMCM